jgi:hypothetical protein
VGGVVERDHRSGPFSGDRILRCRNHLVFHDESIFEDLDCACADQDGIGVVQRQAKPATRRVQNGAHLELVIRRQEVASIEKGYPSGLEETEDDRVVEVAVGVHLAPLHGELHDDRKALEVFV